VTLLSPPAVSVLDPRWEGIGDPVTLWFDLLSAYPFLCPARTARKDSQRHPRQYAPLVRWLPHRYLALPHGQFDGL